MSSFAETMVEMSDAARDLGASLMRLVSGARVPIDSADLSAVSGLNADEGRKRNDSAGNADAR